MVFYRLYYFLLLSEDCYLAKLVVSGTFESYKLSELSWIGVNVPLIAKPCGLSSRKSAN